MIYYLSSTRDREPLCVSCNKSTVPLDLQHTTYISIYHCKSEYLIENEKIYDKHANRHQKTKKENDYNRKIYKHNIHTIIWISQASRHIWHIPWKTCHIYIVCWTMNWNNGNILFKRSCTDISQRSVNTKVLSLLGLNKAL